MVEFAFDSSEDKALADDGEGDCLGFELQKRPQHGDNKRLNHVDFRWLGVRDGIRNGCSWARRPAKGHENRGLCRMAALGAARSRLASGAVEAEQLCGPERA